MGLGFWLMVLTFDDDGEFGVMIIAVASFSFGF
jgi:hypothetical protein